MTPLDQQPGGVPYLLEDLRDHALGTLGVHQHAVDQSVERRAMPALQFRQGGRVTSCNTVQEHLVGNRDEHKSP